MQTKKTKAVPAFEASVTIYNLTWRNVDENLSIQQHRR